MLVAICLTSSYIPVRFQNNIAKSFTVQFTLRLDFSFQMKMLFIVQYRVIKGTFYYDMNFAVSIPLLTHAVALLL